MSRFDTPADRLQRQGLQCRGTMNDLPDVDGARGAWRAPRGRVLLGAAIVISILGLNLLRAIHQPVVHDEALTYNHFVPLSWNAIRWAFHSNNHTLHTLLVKASTTFLGLTPLSLRLPALLGGLLYLLAAERLCRRAFRSTTRYVFGLLGLSASPFILDYLVAARGYGLALGFLRWALVVSWKWLDLSERQRDRCRLGLLPLVSVLCALSVASNLAFAFVGAALLLALWMAGQLLPTGSRRRALVEGALTLSIPGGILYLLIDPGILRFDGATLFFGAGSWAVTWESLLDPLFGSFGGPGGHPWIRTALPLGVQFLLLLLAGLAAGVMLRRLLDRTTNDRSVGRDPGADNATLLLLTGSILVVTILLHGVAHGLAGILLPMERTGIFFVPLALLIVLLVPGSLPGGAFRRVAGNVVTGAVTLFVVLFLTFGHIRYFEQWRYDANSRNVFLAVRALAQGSPGAPIGIDWLLEPSLNFYRTLFHAEFLPPFTRRPPTIDDTIFVLLPGRSEQDRRLLRSLPLRIVLADPLSGVVVASKPPPGVETGAREPGRRAQPDD